MTSNLKSELAGLRREHILKAASDVFAENGFRRSTIRDVAAAAGVADGTIYNVFANKDDLLAALLEKLRPVNASPQPAQPERQDNLLHTLFRERLQDLTPDNLKLLRVVLAEALVDADLRSKFLAQVIDPVIAPLEKVIETQQLFGARTAREVVETSRLLVSLFLGLALLRMLDEPVVTNDLPGLAESFARILNRGLAS
jgi:AcrR family transcriptional regulator